MKNFMKKKLAIAALVPMIGLPFAASSFAQTSGSQDTQQSQSQPQSQAQSSPQQMQGQQQSKQSMQSVRDMRASKIIGTQVKTSNGEKLGEVKDLVVDVKSGKIEYVVLGQGGVLGINEKMVPVPVKRIQGVGNEGALVANLTEKELKEAPAFERSNWSNLSTNEYRQQVAKHFNESASQSDMNLARMDQLMDEKVVDRSGKEVGKVSDAAMDMQNKTVRFVALEPVGVNKEGELIVMPIHVFDVKPEGTKSASAQQSQQQQMPQQAQSNQPQQSSGQSAQAGQSAVGAGEEVIVVLNVDPQKMQNARTMPREQWGNINDEAFRGDMDRYLGMFGPAPNMNANIGDREKDANLSTRSSDTALSGATERYSSSGGGQSGSSASGGSSSASGASSSPSATPSTSSSSGGSSGGASTSSGSSSGGASSSAMSGSNSAGESSKDKTVVVPVVPVVPVPDTTQQQQR